MRKAALTLAGMVTLVAGGLTPASAMTASFTPNRQPDAVALTSTNTDAGVIPLKNAAMITKTTKGYLYTAGQQDSHLVMTVVNGRLLLVDTNTLQLRSIPASCHKRSVPVGIAASCSVPASVSPSRPMTISLVLRLGNDFADSSTLSAAFQLSALVDAGRDVVYAGAGDDFVNGAQNNDRVSGGAGNDWIRTGLGNDKIKGGPGNDRLNGVYGNDTVHGGPGNDRLGGGFGDDKLYAGSGNDLLACGSGRDHGYFDYTDTANNCEFKN